jgi:hypothetical protein
LTGYRTRRRGQGNRVRLVLLDLTMPMMSGSSESPLKETSEHFLAKPLRMAELTDAVATLLQRRT